MSEGKEWETEGDLEASITWQDETRVVVVYGVAWEAGGATGVAGGGAGVAKGAEEARSATSGREGQSEGDLRCWGSREGAGVAGGASVGDWVAGVAKMLKKPGKYLTWQGSD